MAPWEEHALSKGAADTQLLLTVATEEDPVGPDISFLKEKPEIWIFFFYETT